MKPFAPKTRVTLTLRNQTVTADAAAYREGQKFTMVVDLQDERGRTLGWTLTRQELSAVARAASLARRGSRAK